MVLADQNGSPEVLSHSCLTFDETCYFLLSLGIHVSFFPGDLQMLTHQDSYMAEWLQLQGDCIWTIVAVVYCEQMHMQRGGEIQVGRTVQSARRYNTR